MGSVTTHVVALSGFEGSNALSLDVRVKTRGTKDGLCDRRDAPKCTWSCDDQYLVGVLVMR